MPIRSLPRRLQERADTHSSSRKPIPTSRKDRLVKTYRTPPQVDFMAQTTTESRDHKASKSASTKETHKAGEISNVPIPTPESKNKPYVGYEPGHTFSMISGTPTYSAVPTASTWSFIPLPPLVTQPPSKTFSLEQASSLAQTATLTDPSFMSRTVQATTVKTNHAQPAKLPVAAIALLAVGSAFVLVGVFIAIKACSRPTQRTRPKPSLPILDQYDDRELDMKEKDSPLFGGKERFSSQNTGLWATAPSVEPIHQAVYTKDTHIENNASRFPISQSSYYTLPNHESELRLLCPYPGPLDGVPALPASHQPGRTENALTRAVSRFSTASLSLYPTSPISAHDIGIAISGRKAFTADGHPILNRTSKAAFRRSRSEMLEELAYDGADVTSPKIVQSPSVPAGSVGRTRIKSSYYTPGSYPRISTIPSSTSTRMRANDPYDAYPFPPMPKCESRRDQDSCAFGLRSPCVEKFPPSPQPTLYPDDSLSVVGKRIAPKSSVDASTALGSLMLDMDFGATSKSLATLAGRLGENISTYNGEMVSATLATSQCKAPRVPSPPPLPSLTQMGLQSADYRSATYSICGLYDDNEGKTSYHR